MDNDRDVPARPDWERAASEKAHMAAFIQVDDQLINRAGLASDIVLYGEDIARVAQSYNLPMRTLRNLMENDRGLQLEIAEATRLLRELGRAQMRARDVFETGIPVLNDLIHSHKTPASEKVRAMNLVAAVGGILPRSGSSGRGAQDSVNVSVPRDMMDVPESTLQVILQMGVRRREQKTIDTDGNPA